MADLPPDPERTSDLSGECGRRELVGEHIGRYRVDLFVGEGGMGEVYRAWDTLLEHWVALKRLRPGPDSDEKSRQLLLREARMASALHHHAIAAIHDVLEVGDELFIVEEFVEGVRLRDRIGEPFDLSSFLRIAEDCAEALVVAAEQGIVHCDLKPENIRLTSDGRPKILDFGIARRTVPESGSQSSLTETLAADGHRPVMGTVAYLAPEVIARCAPTARSDLFSLGIVFYEILAGLNPFKKETRDDTFTSILADRHTPPSELNSDVPVALDEVVARLLAKAPQDRYATAAELRDALRAVREGAREPAAPPPVPFAQARILGVPFIAFASLSIVILLSIAIFGWPPWSRRAQASHYLAIVPFENLGDDPKVQSFSLGLTGALQARLASLEGISVVDPTSEVASVPGTKPLRVELIVEGELQRSRDRVRINYKILEGVDAEERIIFDGGTVEGEIGEIFDLQDGVAEKICRAVAGRYGLRIELAAASQPTRDAAAYDLYLQARGYLANAGAAENIEMATALFLGALARDPGFVLARAGLAEAHWKRYEATRDSTWGGKALVAARAAVSAGPNVAEARVTLASILFGTERIESAAEEYRRAIEIDPRGNAGYNGLARAEERLGRLDAADTTLHRAILARPEDWSPQNDLGAFYYRHGRLEDAIACFRRVVEIAPDSTRGYSNLGVIYQLAGRNDEALAAYERSLEIKSNYPAHSNLATLLRTRGRFEESARNYEKALVLKDDDYRIWVGLSDTYRRIPGSEKRADTTGARAAVLIERRLVSQPNDATLLVVLSQLYGHRGRLEDARRSVERALALAPEQVEILLNAAETFEILGERTIALGTLEKAIQRGAPIEVVKQEPGLARLVEDPRFERLVRSVQAGNRPEAR